MRGLDRHVLSIAAVVVSGAVMSILDTTIVNIALRTLAEDLDAPLDAVQWVATGYLLALALVIPLTGWASERFGARRVWLTSVALFVAGSVLCGIAWSLGSLIAFRVLQGIGGGMIMPVGMALLAQAAGPQRMGRVMSIIGVPMVLAPALGPVLGGLIVEHLDWRWIFFVNVPVGAIGIALGRRLLPRDTALADPGRLDVLGLALLSPGLAAVVFGLTEVSTHGGLGALVAWGPLLGGALLVIAFVVHARRAPRPLIDVGLFSHRAFASAAATNLLVGAALFGGLLIMPMFFQVARGESVVGAGLLLMAQGVGVALAMPVTGTLADRFGGGRVALFGLAVLALSTLPFAVVDADTPTGWLEAALLVRGVGIGASMMPAMAAAYATLDRAAVPRATSALNVIQRIGGALGTAVLAVVLQGELSDRLPGAGGGGLDGPAGALPRAAAQSVAEAFGATFWWAVGLTVVAALPALVLVRATRRATPGAAEAAAGPVIA